MSSEKEQTFRLKDLPRPLLIVVGTVSLIAVAMLIAFLMTFGWTPNEKHADWGTFGDFMGGILNPLIAFAALMALLCAIGLQQSELRATRIALHKSSEAMKEQQKVLQIQTFDETYFKLVQRLEVYLKSIATTDEKGDTASAVEFWLKSFASKGIPIGLFDRARVAEQLDATLESFRKLYGIHFTPWAAFSTKQLLEHVLLITSQLQAQIEITPERLPLYLGLLKPVLSGTEWFAIALRLLYENTEQSSADLRFLHQHHLLDEIPRGEGFWGTGSPWPLFCHVTGLPEPELPPPFPVPVSIDQASATA